MKKLAKKSADKAIHLRLVDIDTGTKTAHYDNPSHAKAWILKHTLLNSDSAVVVQDSRYISSDSTQQLMIKGVTWSDIWSAVAAQQSNPTSKKGIARKQAREELQALLAKYVDDADGIPDLMADIQERFVIYKKQEQAE